MHLPGRSHRGITPKPSQEQRANPKPAPDPSPRRRTSPQSASTPPIRHTAPSPPSPPGPPNLPRPPTAPNPPSPATAPSPPFLPSPPSIPSPPSPPSPPNPYSPHLNLGRPSPFSTVRHRSEPEDTSRVEERPSSSFSSRLMETVANSSPTGQQAGQYMANRNRNQEQARQQNTSWFGGRSDAEPANRNPSGSSWFGGGSSGGAGAAPSTAPSSSRYESTGFGGHISGQFIPTAERNNVDLVYVCQSLYVSWLTIHIETLLFHVRNLVSRCALKRSIINLNPNAW